ncbi:hypothetical protein ACJMK2_034376, partial [Sinanodonta woodiana]
MRPQEVTQQEKWHEILTPNKTVKSPVNDPVTTSNPFEALTIVDVTTFNLDKESPTPLRTSTPKPRRTSNKRKKRSPASIEKVAMKTQNPRKHKLVESVEEPIITVDTPQTIDTTFKEQQPSQQVTEQKEPNEQNITQEKTQEKTLAQENATMD